MKTADSLKQLLASTYTLMLKVQNYHWNVTWKWFFRVHLFTEEIYEELFKKVDDTAERIRALWEKAPWSYSKFVELSFISEENWEKNEEEIIKELLSDFEKLNSFIKETISLAWEIWDEWTLDLLSPMISEYEKKIWIMKSYLD